MEKIRAELLPVVATLVEKLAFEFIDLELKGSKNNLIVRVIADAEGGITIGACAALSRVLADEFERKDLLSGRYRLEVSSPGLDRPLRSPRDFKRNLGREVVIHWRRAEGPPEIEGHLRAVSETEVEIVSRGENRRIPFAEIEFGKIKIKW
jgi:ribosome maturation factor RimP